MDRPRLKTAFVTRGHTQALKDGTVKPRTSFRCARSTTAPSCTTRRRGSAWGVNRGYTVTTGLWARSILQHHYGVDLNRVTWVLSGDEHVAEYRPPTNAVPIETGRKMEESSSRARFRQPSACRGSIHLRAFELFDQPCMVSGWQADSRRRGSRFERFPFRRLLAARLGSSGVGCRTWFCSTSPVLRNELRPPGYPTSLNSSGALGLANQANRDRGRHGRIILTWPHCHGYLWT